MTRPVVPRPGIKVRRQQRRAFKVLKAAVSVSPSMAAYRAANRRQAAADRARKKLFRAGVLREPTRPLTAIEWEALTAPARREEARQLGLAPR